MYRTFLVHLTGSASDANILTTARHLASPFAAHLDCLHVGPTASSLVVAAVGNGSVEATVISTELFDALKEAAQERRHRAHRTYTEFCKRERITQLDSPAVQNAVTAAWIEKDGNTIDCLASEARFHDLLVLASRGTDQNSLSSHDLGSVILAAGRPILLVPAKPNEARIRTIAVAWKDTPEAARAITAAMPLLSKAARIVLLSANEENDKAIECIDCSDSVAGHLRWHGLNAETRYVIPAGRSIPDAVLETAHEIGADVLVMGAYGRTRLSEMVFGGFTRRVLAGADLPVFLFH